MAPWKKTFYCAYAAQILAIMGFSFIMPFLPFYLEELGVTGAARLRIWSGIIISAPAITLMISAPLWGILADRYGRKPMVLRAMFGGALVLALMALVRTPTQLLGCRLLQGALTGTIGASVALVASVAPSNRRGYTLGMMQSAVFTGFAIGPALGGLVSDHFGTRWACASGAAVLLCAALLIMFGTREQFEGENTNGAGCRAALKAVLTGFKAIFMTPGFLLATLVMMSMRFSNSVANPAFPLIVAELWHDPATLKTITGTIITCGGVMAAISAAISGRMSDAWGHKRILVIFSGATAVVLVAHVFANSVQHLYVVRALFGLTVAGMIPATNAIIRDAVHGSDVGKAFGLATSLGTFGWFLGPLTGGFVAAAYGLRTPFVLGGVCMLLVTVFAATCLAHDPDQRKVAAE